MSAIKRKPEIYSDSEDSSTEEVQDLTIDDHPKTPDLSYLPETQDPDLMLQPVTYKDTTDGVISDKLTECVKDFITLLAQCLILFNSLEEATDSIITYVTLSKKGPNSGILDIMDHLTEILEGVNMSKLPAVLWRHRKQISHILSTSTSNIKSILAQLRSFYKKFSTEERNKSSSCSGVKRLKLMESTSTSSTVAFDQTDNADASSGVSSIMNLGLPNSNQLQDMIHQRTEKISSTIYASNKEGSVLYTFQDPNPKPYIVQLQIYPTKAIALEEKKNWWKHRVRQHLFHCDIENNQDPRARYLQKVIEEEHIYLDRLKKNGIHIEENIRSKLL